MKKAQDLPPPGWYDNPVKEGQLRWWDGSAWSEHTRSAEASGQQGFDALDAVQSQEPQVATSEPDDPDDPARVPRWTKTRKTAKGMGQVVNAGFHLAAVLGVTSNDPKLRRASTLVLAQDARDRVLRGMGAGDSVPGSTPTQPPSSSIRFGDLSGETQQALLRIQNTAKRPPGDVRTNQKLGQIVHALGLSGDAATFGLGACFLGYCARQVEGQQEQNLAPAEVTGALDGLRAELTSSGPSEEMFVPGFHWGGPQQWGSVARDEQSAICAVEIAGRYATGRKVDGRPLDAMALDGPFQQDRAWLRQSSLHLLTTSGADFKKVPAGISAEQIDSCWNYGYVLRAADDALAA